jgi:RNA polymerase sigma-70 factor (ECF subfamily)
VTAECQLIQSPAATGGVPELIKRFGRPREPRHPEEVAIENEAIAMISRLPTDQAAALVLRHYHGYTNREIARSLRIPERTVASRLARGRARLCQLICA